MTELKFLFLLTIALLFFNFCSNELKENKKWNLIKKNGLLYADSLATEPFTGHYKGTVMGKQIEYEVVSGKMSGIFVLYFENGYVETQGFLKENKNHGIWKYYYPDGKLESTGIFTEDQPDSLWVWFNNSGVLILEGFYKNGKKEGEWKFYDDSGQLFLIRNFINDELIDSVWYANDNLLIDSLTPN